MRRWAVLATVFIVLASTASMANGAAASLRTKAVRASSSRAGPGTDWVMWSAGGCETEAFGRHHTFVATGNNTGLGNGDRGVYGVSGKSSKRLTMTWTAGAGVGGVFHGRFDPQADLYGGPGTVDGETVEDANLDQASYRSCPVFTSTLGTVHGNADDDTVTVTGTGGVTPTGPIDFWACQDASGSCEPNTVGSIPLGAQTLSGTGDSATVTATFTAPTNGRYCFYNSYAGDSHYGSIADASDNLCFTPASAIPAVTAAPALPEIQLLGSDTDTATVTGQAGALPSGTITFYVCGPSSSPSSPCTPHDGTEVGAPVNLEVNPLSSPFENSAMSVPFTPTAAGVYCFLALYSGDTVYAPESDGSTSDQCFSARGPGPEITTEPAASSIVLGATDRDMATLTGEEDVTPTGNMHFYACPASDDPCATTDVDAVDLGTTPLSGSGNTATAASAAFSPPALGDYCFLAVYSGDDNYGSETGTSDGECFTVTSFTPALMGLGSPENSFGTGNLPLGPDGTSEETPTGIWAAVSGYCTSKENGDEYLSAFDATYIGSATWLCSATPTARDPDATNNYEYNGNDGSGYSYAGGYSYDIVTPSSASGVTNDPITVDAFDPAFEISPCTGSGALGSPDGNNGGPTSNITTAYDLTYSPVPLDPGQDVAVPGLVIGSTSAPPIVAGTTNQYVAASGDQTTCGLWTTLFTIPAGSIDGDYRLDVSTPQTFSPMQNSDGSNAYALRVYEGTGTIPPTEANLAGPWTRCSTITTDAWYSPTCPVIQGQNALSVYVNQSGNTGSFYLAQIPSSDAGQVLRVHLFDPGEGDHYVELLDPDDPTQPVSFSWETTDDCPLAAPNEDSTDCAEDIGPGVFHYLSGATSMLDVSQTLTPPPGEASDSLFNDRELELTFTIPADYAASDGGWWKIQYISGTGAVSDRTTWTVSVGGSSGGAIASSARRATKGPPRRPGAPPRP
jgi:hypothetical protein